MMPNIHRIMRRIQPLVAMVAIVAIWEMSGQLGWVAPYILPPPTDIVSKLVANYPVLLFHTWVTASEIVLGFFAAIAMGVVLALAITFVEPLERTLMPLIVASQAVPKVALSPLIVVWFGFGLFPKVLISALISFFPIMIGMIVGLRSIERDTIYLLQSMGAGFFKLFWYAQLPNGLPSIFAGLKTGIILACVGAIVGEFVGANSGLGYIMITANGLMDTSLLFAALLLITVVSVTFYSLLVLSEKLLLGWHVSVRTSVESATM